MEDAVLATDWSALEDGADPEKQNEERNEHAGKMRKVGGCYMLQRNRIRVMRKDLAFRGINIAFFVFYAILCIFSLL